MPPVKPLEPPDNLHLKAAQGWLELGNHLEANAESENIAAAMRSHPDVLELRWQIYAKAKQRKACVDIASALVKLAPDPPSGWIHRSYALHELTRTQEASDEMLPAVDQFTKNWLICYNLACYACQLGNRAESRVWLERAFELGDAKKVKLLALEDPDLEPLWSNIGQD